MRPENGEFPEVILELSSSYIIVRMRKIVRRLTGETMQLLRADIRSRDSDAILQLDPMLSLSLSLSNPLSVQGSVAFFEPALSTA